MIFSLDALLRKYNDKKYSFKIRTLNSENSELEIFVYELKRIPILGLYKKTMIERQMFKHFPFFAKSKFGNDTNINFTDYVLFVEKGFNENPMNDYRLDLLHAAVGMSEESGEILGHLKKHIFHNKDLDRTKLVLEFGDKLWYTVACMTLLDITLTEIIEGNISKLQTRYPNGRDKNYKLNIRDEDNEAKIAEQNSKKRNSNG